MVTTSSEPVTPTSSERRLHPVGIVFDLVLALPRVLWPMAVAFIGVWRTGAGMWIVLGGVVIAVVSAIVAGARFYRFTYRYEERDLVVRSGVIFRNERRIPYVRIQNLDASQNLFHRLFGVASVFVQTGGSALPEATLRVLPIAALEEMRAHVHAWNRAHAGARVANVDRTAANGGAGMPGDAAAASAGAGMTADASGGMRSATARDAESAQSASVASQPVTVASGTASEAGRRQLLRLEAGELIAAGFIENRGLVLIAGALALLQQVGQAEYTERLIDGSLRRAIASYTGGLDIPVVLGAIYVIILLLMLLVFVRVLSTIWALVRLWDFRLDRVGDELHMEYGLLTRVTATIPLRRVQTIIVREGLVHRMLGRCSIAIETAGGLNVGAGAPQREPIAPIIARDRARALLNEIQPGVDPDAIEWQPVHRRAFGRILRSESLIPLAIALGSWALVREWAIGVWLLLLVYVIVRARLRSRVLGWSLGSDSIAVRDGALMKTIRIARYNRVQVTAIHRNPFDLRTKMATVLVDTAGSRYRGTAVPYLPERTAIELHDQLLTRTAATGFTW